MSRGGTDASSGLNKSSVFPSQDRTSSKSCRAPFLRLVYLNSCPGPIIFSIPGTEFEKPELVLGEKARLQHAKTSSMHALGARTPCRPSACETAMGGTAPLNAFCGS